MDHRPAVSYYRAANHLHVHPRTVAKWIDQGRLKATGERNTWRISLADLNAFCREHGFAEMPADSAEVN